MSLLEVSGLGKSYKTYPSRWRRLAEWLDPRGKPWHQTTWVLRDVSFRVDPGEAVGVVGINGAGKSTLLKIITGTTRATTGNVRLTGRLAALLELGMGFHPDYSGRQNVEMAALLLGHDAAEIQRAMPQIEAFAEIGAYIDQPVRVYSSGMQIRLAFAVATAWRPDILIVDEALSVGDAYFQNRSFERIREFRRLGTTLLLVSHDRQAIQSICDRALLLDSGSLVMTGSPATVMDYYNAMLADRSGRSIRQTETASGQVQTVSGSGEVLIDEISLLDSRGHAAEAVQVGESLRLQVRLQAQESVPDLVVGYMIKDRLGQAVSGTNSHQLGAQKSGLQRGESTCFEFAFPANLGEGDYSIAVAAHASDTHIERNYHWRDLALMFKVVNTDKPRFVGVSWLPTSFNRQP